MQELKKSGVLIEYSFKDWEKGERFVGCYKSKQKWDDCITFKRCSMNLWH